MVVPTFVRIVPQVQVMMSTLSHFRDSQIKVVLSRIATVTFYFSSWWLLLLSYCRLPLQIRIN